MPAYELRMSDWSSDVCSSDPIRPKRALLIRRHIPPLAPLLEEERHAGRRALVADRARPVGMHRPRAGPALAADDDPVNARAGAFVFPHNAPVFIGAAV